MSLSGVRITCTPQSPSWEHWLAGRQDASRLVTRTLPVQLLKTQTSFLWAVPLRCPSWLSELNFTFSIVLSVTKRVGLPPSKRGSEKPASDLVFSSQLCTSNRLQSYELGHSCCLHEHIWLHVSNGSTPSATRTGLFQWVSDASQCVSGYLGYLHPQWAFSSRGKDGPQEWQVTLEGGDVCLATKLSSGCTIFLILPFCFFSFPSFPVLASETIVCLPTPSLTPDTTPHPLQPPQLGTALWSCYFTHE